MSRKCKCKNQLIRSQVQLALLTASNKFCSNKMKMKMKMKKKGRLMMKLIQGKSPEKF